MLGKGARNQETNNPIYGLDNVQQQESNGRNETSSRSSRMTHQSQQENFLSLRSAIEREMTIPLSTTHQDFPLMNELVRVRSDDSHTTSSTIETLSPAQPISREEIIGIISTVLDLIDGDAASFLAT